MVGAILDLIICTKIISAMPTLHIQVKGKVQGVFYRISAKNAAIKYGIAGWVKNTRAGDVEIIANGTGAQLQKFLDWCSQGPPSAAVVDVIITPKAESTLTGFNILK